METREEVKDLINWNELSRQLTGNTNNITRKKLPTKYKIIVESLFLCLEIWIKLKNKK